MFGIGLAELAVIAFFGVVVLGPDKLPGLAKQLAQGVRSVKRMTDTVRDDLRESLGDEYADLELHDLHPRALVRRHVLEALEAESAADDHRADEVEDDLHHFTAARGADTEADRDTRAPHDERKTA